MTRGFGLILTATLAALVSPALGRGGGGCLEEGAAVLTPDGPVAVQSLKPGDRVVTIIGTQAGTGAVAATYRVQPESYIQIDVPGRSLRVTGEHPVMIGEGVFCAASALKAGQSVYVYDGKQAAQAPIIAMRQVPARAVAYNVLVDRGGTFVADGVVVHNKGCFLPDTPILRADGQWTAIGSLSTGDRLMAFRSDGGSVETSVQAIIKNQVDRYVELATDRVVLYVTEDHPFYIGDGVYKTPSALKAGDCVMAFDGRGLTSRRIASIKIVERPATVYNLQTDWPNTFFAAGVAVHNKGGGCFPAGTMIQTPAGRQAIESLQQGDVVAGVDLAGAAVSTAVEGIYATSSLLVLVETSAGTLRTTAEHPIAVAGGAFCPAGDLQPGQQIVTWRGSRAGLATVQRVRQTGLKCTVFNLSVGRPHTFIADGVVVHNKGGGCFPAGTLISTASGPKAIESLRAGQQVQALADDGTLVDVQVLSVFGMRSEVVVVHTDRGELRTTRDHPLRLGDGGFCLAGDLLPGNRVTLVRDRKVHGASVRGVQHTGKEEIVYNLQVESPHTFIADGFVVHNKGGGGFHGSRGFGGSRSGRGSGGSPDFPCWLPLAIIGFIVIVAIAAQKKRKDEDLDFVYSPSAVAAKAGKTGKLLEFIAKVNGDFSPDALRQAAGKTFVQLQTCWQARDYAPMKPLMMADLFCQHTAQLAAMKTSHETNMIADLVVDRIDLVNVRYTDNSDHREFTALITARARDYYVDDRTGRFLRGDQALARFQEFWTFQRSGNAWLLREIEQTRESDALKEENFFEQFTETGKRQVYGEQAGQTGPAGPWLDKRTATKADRIDRLLAFLVQTDGLWDRAGMIERARQVFLHVYMAQQGVQEPEIDELFPEVSDNLSEMVRRWRADGMVVEYRNLCIRKVELVLVRNFADNARDEFTARISAHARKIFTRGGRVSWQDEDVRPFVEFWTFGRLDNRWKLKEVLPQAKGQEAIGQENVDEGSSPSQMQWFYRQERAT